ncbi:MAG: hypothetical protein ABIF40_02085 [archaeon]
MGQNNNYGPIRETNPIIEYGEQLLSGALALDSAFYGLATLNSSTSDYTLSSYNPSPNIVQVDRTELSDILGHYSNELEPTYENVPGYKSVINPTSVPYADNIMMGGDFSL